MSAAFTPIHFSVKSILSGLQHFSDNTLGSLLYQIYIMYTPSLHRVIITFYCVSLPPSEAHVLHSRVEVRLGADCNEKSDEKVGLLRISLSWVPPVVRVSF